MDEEGRQLGGVYIPTKAQLPTFFHLYATNRKHRSHQSIVVLRGLEMLGKLYRRVRLWIFPEAQQFIDPHEDHSSLATLVRLLQEEDASSG